MEAIHFKSYLGVTLIQPSGIPKHSLTPRLSWWINAALTARIGTPPLNIKFGIFLNFPYVLESFFQNSNTKSVYTLHQTKFKNIICKMHLSSTLIHDSITYWNKMLYLNYRSKYGTYSKTKTLKIHLGTGKLYENSPNLISNNDKIFKKINKSNTKESKLQHAMYCTTYNGVT